MSPLPHFVPKLLDLVVETAPAGKTDTGIWHGQLPESADDTTVANAWREPGLSSAPHQADKYNLRPPQPQYAG